MQISRKTWRKINIEQELENKQTPRDKQEYKQKPHEPARRS